MKRGTSRGLTDSKLETKIAGDNARRPPSDEDEQPDSVIHAPEGFPSFVSTLIATLLLLSHMFIERTEIPSVQTALYSFTIAAIRLDCHLSRSFKSRARRECMELPMSIWAIEVLKMC